MKARCESALRGSTARCWRQILAPVQPVVLVSGPFRKNGPERFDVGRECASGLRREARLRSRNPAVVWKDQ